MSAAGNERTGRRGPSHATVVAYLALFVALGGTAWAAAKIDSRDIKRDAVKAKHIREDAVRADEIRADAVSGPEILDGSVAGVDVTDDSLTGADIVEASLGPVPKAIDSDRLGGRVADDYLRDAFDVNTSPISEGFLVSEDGTYFLSASCDEGDKLLSGGPVQVKAPSVVVESAPSGASNTWNVRIDKNGQASDPFGVVVRCVNQP